MLRRALHEGRTALRRLAVLLTLLLALTLIGTVGLRLITGGRWLDCLYMAVITLTTVGYEESVPLGDAGRVFIIVYLVFGFGVFSFTAVNLVQSVLSPEIRGLLERNRMENVIAKLKNHEIVCGMGRMGVTICQQLHASGRAFVVVDCNAELVRRQCQEHHWAYVIGDATEDATLKEAGIERARSLATVLHTDADNIYVILTSRILAPGLQILARASEDSVVAKMERAGATRVVSPHTTGAMKMARFLLNPNVEDFLEIADRRGQGLELADVKIQPGSQYVGKRIADTCLARLGVIIVGLRRQSGERLMPVQSETEINAGDCLFAFGSTEAVNRMIEESASTDVGFD